MTRRMVEPTPGPEQYLDAAATAPLRPEARDAMLEVWESGQANASSVHAPGHRARAFLTAARGAIADGLGARPAEVVFTSGGTEANNLAIIGLALALARPRGSHLVTTPLEHPSVLGSCRYLERVFGFEVTQLPTDADGRVRVEDVRRSVRDDTTLLSVGLANGEIGTVQDLPAIAAVARECGALVHTDAVQAAAALPVSFGSGWPGPDVDALTVAAHKFGGPQGAGALLARTGVSIEPLLHGGGQERGARSGTENVAAISGFAAAVTAHAREVGTRALALLDSRDRLIAAVRERVPGARLVGHPSERLPGHAAFVVPGVSGESLLVALDAAGFAVSSGSACAAGHDAPSPALLALGIDAELAQTAIRFTLPAPLPPETIARIAEVVAAEVHAAASRMSGRAGKTDRSTH